MKKKLLVMVMLCAMVLAAISPGTVEAAQWYTCNISQAGSTTWGGFVMLTDTAGTPAFQNMIFYLDPAAGKEMLASALTAYANSTTVWAYIADPVQYSTVSGLFATK
jgi:hypothetical protein